MTSAQQDTADCGRNQLSLHRAKWLEVDVVTQSDDWQDVPRVVPLVQDAIDAALAVPQVMDHFRSPQRKSQLTVALSDDAMLRQLNCVHRGVDKPTNVLSFPHVSAAVPPGDDHHYLGDVVLAFDTVRCEAEAQGTTLQDHISHLVIHGFLHLLDYDHQTDEEADEMERLEILALARLNIANPYANGADHSLQNDS